MQPALIALAACSAAAWLVLIAARGGFWRTDIRLDGAPPALPVWPHVVAIVPARNEADVIATSMSSLLEQRYRGGLDVILVDDESDDRTAATAQAAADALRQSSRLTVIAGRPRPTGWAGKVWALAQGLAEADIRFAGAAYVWLTDADIAHDRDNLARLIAKAETDDRDLVSQMVVLATQGFWERLLVPAFVLFFAKLYPFAWCNDPRSRTAAAAGGSVVVRRAALHRAGGLDAIRDALIDDCALAAAVKRNGRAEGGRLWLGLTRSARSLRPYGGLAGVWRMVARSAYTQLRHSPLLLAATLAGMLLLYAVPPALGLLYPLHGAETVLALAMAAWAMMTLAAVPVFAFYRALFLAPLLPLAGGLYAAMTLDSARGHARGRGGQWKGRPQAGLAGNPPRHGKRT